MSHLTERIAANLPLGILALIVTAALLRGIYLTIAANEALADLERDDWEA